MIVYSIISDDNVWCRSELSNGHCGQWQ